MLNLYRYVPYPINPDLAFYRALLSRAQLQGQ